ncbi:MAG: hypothetical protein ACSLFE_08650, partial [Gemmatimonadaceae bacterium]
MRYARTITTLACAALLVASLACRGRERTAEVDRAELGTPAGTPAGTPVADVERARPDTTVVARRDTAEQPGALGTVPTA